MLCSFTASAQCQLQLATASTGRNPQGTRFNYQNDSRCSIQITRIQVERELKVSSFNLLRTKNQKKQIQEEYLRLGVTTLLYQSNHTIEKINLIIQVIEVDGLRVKRIYAFSQRSQTGKANLITYFHGIRNIKATRFSNQISQSKP